MAHNLKFYYDSALRKPVDVFDFGRVEVSTGHDLIFYIKNTSSRWPIVDIEVGIPNEDCEMVDIPKRLSPLQVSKCRYRCDPSLNIDEPLAFFTKITGRLEIG